jgi:hypothetical protein
MMLLQVLVLVNLVGVGERTVEARYAADSSLELSAGDVRDLLGVAASTPYISVPDLARAYPAATFTWLPRRLALIVDDPRAVLPASQAAQAALQRSAQGVPGFAYRRVSGMYGAVAADDSGRSIASLGYAFRGLVTVEGDYLPALHRGQWQAALAPVPQVSLAVAGDRAVASAALRVAAGPAFAFATWQAGVVALDVLVASHGVSLFASTRGALLMTINRAPLAVQVGRSGKSTTARFSFGPSPVSPFFLPYIPPR